MKTLPPAFVVAVLALGVLLTIEVAPGVFLIDDDNYLVNVVALRHGHVTIANTEGLSPSRELIFFDPTSRWRPVYSTPVASTAPPLYAVIALPFSWIGWRGLVALNTLGYLATIVMVFLYTRRHADDVSAPWLAAGAFALGGYAIDYALGLWPHGLSIALCTAGIVLAGRVIEEDDGIARAAASGFLLAMAAGVRYQNAVILATVGVALAMFTTRRWTRVAVFAAAAAVPLAVSGAINHFRFQSWNPISKGPGYLDLPVARGAAASNALRDSLVMFWARLVDFSVRPPLVGDFLDWVRYDATTGAHLIFRVTLKKALLQSAPWAIVGLILLAAAWASAFQIPKSKRQQLRLMSLVTFAVIGIFSIAGVDRHDGASFNERYLLETLPLTAVAFGWALDTRIRRITPLAVGAAVGGGVAFAIILGTPINGGPDILVWRLRQLALLKIPLLLATVLAASWITNLRERGRGVFLTGAAGACLAWGLIIHLGTDVLTAQYVRSGSRSRTAALDAALPDHSALIAYGGSKDAAGPLLFHRDIVILEAWADDGRDAPVLIRELLRSKRRVFVLMDAFPPDVIRRVIAGLDTANVGNTNEPILELRLKPT